MSAGGRRWCPLKARDRGPAAARRRALSGEVRPHEQRHHHRGVPGQAGKLAVLLDALDGVVISEAERAALTWLAGFEAHTVENIAAVLDSVRQGR